jgi:cob(I)alamin adenosyltransferase
MDLNEKIKKTTEDIERLQEKLKNKKKELAMLESKKQEQEQRERISRNEKFISRIEEKIGGNVTDDLLQKIMRQLEKEQEHTNE